MPTETTVEPHDPLYRYHRFPLRSSPQPTSSFLIVPTILGHGPTAAIASLISVAPPHTSYHHDGVENTPAIMQSYVNKVSSSLIIFC
jgi:hypothetical protein